MSTEETIDQLREKADQATKLADTNAQQAKEIAFLNAGIKTNNELGQMMVGNYQGELEEQAILDYVGRLGVMPDTTPDPIPTPTPTPPAEPPSPIGDLSNLGGATPPEAQTPANLIEEGFEAFKKAQVEGKSRNSAAAEVLQRIIHGAVQQSRGVEGFDGFLYEREKFHEGDESPK